MTYDGKEYILTENEGKACLNCPLEGLCDLLADDFGIDYELCATEENFGEFENPIYAEKKEEDE